jgi:hypothetical protein
MPSNSKAQQRLMGWALACKRGESTNCPPKVKEIADRMSEEELEKYASTSHEDLPDRVSEQLANEAIAEIIAINEGAIKHLLELATESANFEDFKRKANQWMKEQGKEPLDEEFLKDAFANARNFLSEERVDEASDKKILIKTEKIPIQGDLIPPPPSGISKGKNFIKPSLYKPPMGKSEHSRRIMSWDQFLKSINYRTHDSIFQRGHGQNLDSSKQ